MNTSVNVPPRFYVNLLKDTKEENNQVVQICRLLSVHVCTPKHVQGVSTEN